MPWAERGPGRQIEPQCDAAVARNRSMAGVLDPSGRDVGVPVAAGAWRRLAPHLTLRFSAEDLPRLLTISYSTCWPSLSVLKPARSTAEMCTNTSCPPPCGAINP